MRLFRKAFQDRDVVVFDGMFSVSRRAVDKAEGENEDGAGSTRRIIEGYASTKTLDLGGDIVLPSAFSQTLVDDFAKNPILLWMHNHFMPIGRVLEARIDEKGLWVRAEIAMDDDEADRVWRLVNQGVLRAFSIGFYIEEGDFQEAGDSWAYIIQRLKLLEISVVSIPMNPDSLFQAAKALGLEPGWKATITAFPNVEAAVSHIKGEIAHYQAKEGRVLSARNRELVQSAYDALGELLGVTNEGGEGDDEYEDEDEKAAAELIAEIEAMEAQLEALNAAA